MRRRVIVLICLLLLMMMAAGAAAEEKLSVVVTNFPCYDILRHVAGDAAEVTMLIHPGAEVHAYDPSPADILMISRADLFVYIGGEGDAWVDGILSSYGDAAPRALRMMDAVGDLLEEEEDGAHAEPEYDEHIWTSPVNAIAMVDAARSALTEADPAREGDYAARAEAYAADIQALDEEIRQLVDTAARREMIFADRFPFAYFAREYGLDYVAAFPSCTADTEPTPQTLMTLINRVVKDGVPAVYTIELSTQAVARAVAEETGAKILTLHSMQTVTQDEFEAGESYVSLMTKNIDALREGLN